MEKKFLVEVLVKKTKINIGKCEDREENPPPIVVLLFKNEMGHYWCN
jgi:hypothetical protein